MLNLKTTTAILAFVAAPALAQSGPWQQCGGSGWTGDTDCVAGWECVYQNEWYSQCLEGDGGGEDPEEPGEPPEEPEEPEEPGNPPSNDCGAASVNQLVGYGSGTTGGGSGSGTTVSSCSQFEDALENGGVIRVSGTLNGCGILRVQDDTTIIGVGSNSGFVGGGLRARQVSNIIIRNLNFHNPPEGSDLIDIDESTYIWVDHCEFSNDGIVGDKDHYDGLLDIKHAADFITVSWNNFLDHWKGSLIGHSANNGGEDRGHFRVTYHHNYWNNVNSRTPSLRFGTGHIYSSCYEDIPTSGINSREGAQVLVEHTYFNNVERAIVTDLDANDPGYAVQRNNVFVNSNTEITQTGSLSPPYSYTTDPADCVCALLGSSAGPGVIA